MTTEKADAPQAIVPSEKERRAGVYSARNLQRVLSGLHKDGLVVLENIIDVKHIDALNEAMTADAEKLMADPEQEYNHNVKSNFLQRPPANKPEHLHEDIYFNSFLLQVANAYLGQTPIWNWLTSNTALANTAGMRQYVHKDSSFDHPGYPYYFIVNVPLCDMSPANGATEFWLGSHAQTSVDDHQTIAEGAGHQQHVSLKSYLPGQRIPWLEGEVVEARRAVRPPVQPSVRRGDVMIRDLRTWHAGMPNNSDRHRVMLGLGYQSPFHPCYRQRMHLPASQQEFFMGGARGRVEVRANFYGDEEFEKTKEDMVFDIRPQYGDDA